MADDQAAPQPQVDEAELAQFLQEVAESEHQIRHPQLFAQICGAIGFDVVQEPHRLEVRRRVAPQA